MSDSEVESGFWIVGCRGRGGKENGKCFLLVKLHIVSLVGIVACYLDGITYCWSHWCEISRHSFMRERGRGFKRMK